MRRLEAVTFLELLIVLAVLGVLLSIGFTRMDSTRLATSQVATGLANNIRRVRFEAIQGNASAYMDFSTAGSGSYTLWLDRTNLGTRDADEVLTSVQFGSGDAAGVELTMASSAQIGFDRRGLPLGGGGTVIVQNRSGTFSRTVSYTAAGDVEVQ